MQIYRRAVAAVAADALALLAAAALRVSCKTYDAAEELAQWSKR